MGVGGVVTTDLGGCPANQLHLIHLLILRLDLGRDRTPAAELWTTPNVQGECRSPSSKPTLVEGLNLILDRIIDIEVVGSIPAAIVNMLGYLPKPNDLPLFLIQLLVDGSYHLVLFLELITSWGSIATCSMLTQVLNFRDVSSWVTRQPSSQIDSSRFQNARAKTRVEGELTVELMFVLRCLFLEVPTSTLPLILLFLLPGDRTRALNFSSKKESLLFFLAGSLAVANLDDSSSSSPSKECLTSSL
ncbi:hypothetical protein Acr_08g0012100 [Actinidia rufa]|uniref:Uncharacterized protein n=1 Tax=Actinidia rufa TaxID=165716 RepID=A0A7J0F2A8_9ERIC|nr:hypothetical protein Acr_08g0012100 [Actinidia rufa]